MMDVETIRPGLWRWTAPHPDWTAKDGGPGGWARDVAASTTRPRGTSSSSIRKSRPAGRQPSGGQRGALLAGPGPGRAAPAAPGGRPAHPGLARAQRQRRLRALPQPARGPASGCPGQPGGGGGDRHGHLRTGRSPPRRGAGLRAPGARDRGGALLPSPHAALMSGDPLVAEGDGRLRLGWIDDEAWKQERLLPTLRPLLDLPLEMVLVPHGRSDPSGGQGGPRPGHPGACLGPGTSTVITASPCGGVRGGAPAVGGGGADRQATLSPVPGDGDRARLPLAPERWAHQRLHGLDGQPAVHHQGDSR